jgi:hypothetical protein
MEAPPSHQVVPSLVPLTRGLAALFWGLPLSLLVGVHTATTGMLPGFGLLPPLLTHGLVAFGAFQMGRFQTQERVWQRALDRVKLVALVNVGLAPFLHWSRVMPHELHFRVAVGVLAVCGLLFLFNLNLALQRLAAMLPDETLRQETHLFTRVNQGLILATLVVVTVAIAARNLHLLSVPMTRALGHLGLPVLLLLVLLPVALTMALLWKTKETVLTSAFAVRH